MWPHENGDQKQYSWPDYASNTHVSLLAEEGESQLEGRCMQALDPISDRRDLTAL